MPWISGSASRPLTLPRSASLLRIVASWSPEAEEAAAFIWAMTWFSYAVRLGTASALAISAMASRPLRCLTSACAACSGLPTSGRTVFDCAEAPPARVNETEAATRAARTNFMAFLLPLVEELLGADQPDLGDPEALRTSHNARHVLIGDKLVGPQVEFRLDRLRRGAAELRLQ